MVEYVDGATDTLRLGKGCKRCQRWSFIVCSLYLQPEGMKLDYCRALHSNLLLLFHMDLPVRELHIHPLDGA